MSDKYIWQHGNIEVVHEQGGQLVENPVLLLNHLEETIAERDAEIERLNIDVAKRIIDWEVRISKLNEHYKTHEKREAAHLAFVEAFDAYLNDAENGNSTTLWQWNKLLSARDGLAAELIRDKLREE